MERERILQERRLRGCEVSLGTFIQRMLLISADFQETCSDVNLSWRSMPKR
jgi:hypothetical protein